MTRFDRYVGIDYSGAATADTPLAGLRVYSATPDEPPIEVVTPEPKLKRWTRRAIATWVNGQIVQDRATIVGIDHGFSFPLAYFETHGLKRDWDEFLDDFVQHWPTDEKETPVDFVRDGVTGNGAMRSGSAKWRRRCEIRAGAAKSVFHFDVPGSVAKSTHAGLPWIRRFRREARRRVHMWPFDGWAVPEGRSVVAEVYPSLWSRTYPREDRTPDQQDAYAVAAWLRDADANGTLVDFLEPTLDDDVVAAARYEGWILGIR